MWGVNPKTLRNYGLRPKLFTSQDGLLEKGAFRLDSLNENTTEWYVLAAEGLMLHGSCNGGLSNKCIWKPLVEHVDSSSSHRCAYIPFITLCTHRHPMHEINISCIINKEYPLFVLWSMFIMALKSFLGYFFVLFVNFGMKCSPKTK